MKAYVCRAMVLQEDQRDGLTGAGGQRFGRWDLAERSKNLQWVRHVSRTSATALHRDTHSSVTFQQMQKGDPQICHNRAGEVGVQPGAGAPNTPLISSFSWLNVW